MQFSADSQLEAAMNADMAASAVAAQEELEMAAAMRRRGVWPRLRRQRVAMACLVLILLFVLAAILAPLLSPHDPDFGYTDGLSAIGTPLGHSAKFPLGTDTVGRDVLSRLLFGARISLTVGILATLLMVTIGVALGVISGFFGGWAEIVITRLIDIMLSFPVVLLGLAAAAIFGPSVPVTIVVIATTQWMYMSRVVYSMVQGLKQWQFVEAARATGIGEWRIMLRHVTPHLAPVVIAYATLGVGVSILLEATLSYLSAGVPLPTASWGSMISDGLTYYRGDPALVLYPGLALATVVLCFTLLGDGLTRALEAR